MAERFSFTSVLRESLKGYLTKLGALGGLLGGILVPGALLKALTPQLDATTHNIAWLTATVFILTVVASTLIIRGLRRSAIHTDQENEKLRVQNISLRDQLRRPSSRSGPEEAFKANSKLFGLYKQFQSKTFRLYDDGSMLIEGSVKVLATSRNLPGIEYFVSGGAPAEEDGDKITIKLGDFTSDSDTKLSKVLVGDQASKNKVRYLLRFDPHLQAGQSVQYDIQEHLPRGSFAMNHKELKHRDMDWEYVSHRVTYPTAELAFQVVFPEQFVPSGYTTDVWCSPFTKIQHPDEYIRIQSPQIFKSFRDARDRLCVSLEIGYPIQGLHYVLKWKLADKESQPKK